MKYAKVCVNSVGPIGPVTPLDNVYPTGFEPKTYQSSSQVGSDLVSCIAGMC